MSIFSTALGMNVVNNPLTDSPYVNQEDFGVSFPSPSAKDLLTEGGTFILTEGSVFLTTE